ncbi:MAG: hypothetical protein JKY34_01420 [Kordiimonadaceae bacterium]|nr:hypothetical protein [Kordiimonadaceae bacterium]
MVDFFRKYLLPGLIFQSVVIGGGYATGRELVEYFFPTGPIGGLLAMAVATIVWSISLALCFEVARITKSYDYRSFFKVMLGRGWVAFEVAYIALIVLVLSTLGAASGEIAALNLGIDPIWGTLAMMVIIAVLVFYGSAVLEMFMAGWSFLLYASYAIFVVFCFQAFGSDISHAFSVAEVQPGWFMGGLQYSGYNLASFAAVLFCIRHLTSRKQAIGAGLLAGPIAMIPGFLFFVAMVGFYPEIKEQSLPVAHLLSVLNIPLFKVLFEIILFGTFIETGAALIHAINERVAEVYHEKGRVLEPWVRPAIAIGTLFVSVVLAAKVGLVNLIAQGYGTITYVFIVLIIVPLCTVGIKRILAHKGEAA